MSREPKKVLFSDVLSPAEEMAQFMPILVTDEGSPLSPAVTILEVLRPAHPVPAARLEALIGSYPTKP